MRRIENIALVLVLVGQPAMAIQIWTSPTQIPQVVPLDCRQALSRNITCANSLIRAQDVINGAALVGEAPGQYCTSECQNSLESFQQSVYANCGKDKEYTLNQNSTSEQFPAALADELLWAYSVSCIKDSTGFCLADLYNGDKSACSDCALKYGAAMMGSDYGHHQIPPAAFSSLLLSCSVPATSYPYSYTPIPTATATTTGSSGIPSSTPVACRGTSYVVKKGDTCESISIAKLVGTDRMIQCNYLDYACSSLTVGSEMCIEDTCTIYTVESNDTCAGIVQGQSFGMVQLVGWNPTLHDDCDNLDSMVGRSLCISPPGGDGEFSLPAPQKTTSQTLTSSIITSWVSATTITDMTNISTSWYYPTLDPNYSPTRSLTPNATFTSLFAERTAYCWLSDETLLDEDFSPMFDLPDDCYSLYNEYCEPEVTDPIPSSTHIPASCTPKTTVYSSTPVVTPSPTTTAPSSTSGVTPTPTQTDMVDGCIDFHKVKAGDECGTIAKDYGITLKDFYTWNPGVGDKCQSLWSGYYVCVAKS